MMKMRDMSDFPFVLTLIATPPLPPITEDMVNAVRGVLLTTDTPQWLEPKVAVDIPFSGTTPQEAREAVKLALMGKQVDVVIQPQKGRRKLMLLADMDGTIMREESLDELADCAGKKLDVASITVRAMRGELDFEGALKARGGHAQRSAR
jgi:phosphoserine phosphatase